MEHLLLIGTILLIHALALASPGPDFILAVRNALTYSRRTGIWTAVGFGSGIAVHIIYCVAGLAYIISQSIVVFSVIKYLGAAYLVYIGIKSWRSKSHGVDIDTDAMQAVEQDITPWKAWRMGFFTNVLNPKATLLFLSLFTFVISPETPGVVVAVASVLMVVNTALWFSLVAIFFSNKRVQNVFNRFQKPFERLFGTLLVALGVKVALSTQE